MCKEIIDKIKSTGVDIDELSTIEYASLDTVYSYVWDGFGHSVGYDSFEQFREEATWRELDEVEVSADFGELDDGQKFVYIPMDRNIVIVKEDEYHGVFNNESD